MPNFTYSEGICLSIHSCCSYKLLHMALPLLNIFHSDHKYNLNTVFSLQSALCILVRNEA